MQDQTFEQRFIGAICDSIIKMARDGSLVSIDYGQRLKLTNVHLQPLYDRIDMKRVYDAALFKVEERIADAMFNSMATEIANDTKQILCNKELREDCRAIIRQKIRDCVDAVTD